MNRRYRDLTPTELEAVKAFAADHGRRWKSVLRDIYWYNARIWRAGPDDSYGYTLHSIRNNLGPDWLAGFRLSK